MPEPARVKARARAKAKVRAKVVMEEKVREQVKQEEVHPRGHLLREGAFSAMGSTGCPSVHSRTL